MATKTKSPISKKEKFSELLLQVNNDLAITNSLDEALEALVGITTSIIKCERGTIFLNDPKSEELYSRVAQGNFMREIRFMNTKGVAGWSYTNEQGAIVHAFINEEPAVRTQMRAINCFTGLNKEQILFIMKEYKNLEEKYKDELEIERLKAK